MGITQYKKELLFYAVCEVRQVWSDYFSVWMSSMKWGDTFNLSDAPWVQEGLNVIVEVAYYTTPGGTKKRCVTITPTQVQEAEE